MQRGDKGSVDVTAQDKVGTGVCPCGDRALMTAKQVFAVFCMPDMDRLMGHDYTQLIRTCLFETPRYPLYLSDRHLALNVPIAPSGANADDQQVTTVMDRFEIPAKGAAISKVRPEQSPRQVEQGNVVIAGDNKA